LRIAPALLLAPLVLLASPASATLFPYALVDGDAVPVGRCKAGAVATENTWPARAGFCHDDPGVACVADPPGDQMTAGLYESAMCSHLPDSTPDQYPLGLCDMSGNSPAAHCTPQTALAVCGESDGCSAGGCAFIGGIARCSMACVPFQGVDVDCDGTPNDLDACPWYPSSVPAALVSPHPLAADPRPAACLCGDLTADGRIDVSDLVAVNTALFVPSRIHPLCDANHDRVCNVSDIVAINRGIFNPGTTICDRDPLRLR
jgi:hypothetical protein